MNWLDTLNPNKEEHTHTHTQTLDLVVDILSNIVKEQIKKNMGSFLDKPKTEKTNESGHGNHLGYGLGAMQGWRIEMEDSHCSLIGLPLSGFEDWSFFAVFDGHAGGTVSKYSAQELIKSILNADMDFFNQLAIVYSTPSHTDSTTSAACSTNGKFLYFNCSLSLILF